MQWSSLQAKFVSDATKSAKSAFFYVCVCCLTPSARVLIVGLDDALPGWNLASVRFVFLQRRR